MKNFTNNFKQFTSRLSARWLIMALMLLLGTSSAWGGVLFTNDYIFLDLSGSQGEWEKDGAVFQVALNEWDHCGSGWSESKLSKKYDLIETSEGSHIYYANVSDDNKSRYGAYFYRCNPSDKSVWNTACIGYGNSTHNCFKVNGWTSSTSTYNLTDIYCISAPTFGEVEVGQSATSSGSYLYAGVSTIPEISNNSTEFQYVAGSSSITTNGLSTITVKFTPSSAGDKTGTLKFGSYLTTSLSGKGKVSCTPETSITSAKLQDGTISLAGNFTTCGAKYHGFQWRKVGSNWCGETDYENNKESNYVVLGSSDVNGSKTGSFTPEDGGTYEFRTYIATTSPWLYSSETIEVSTCVSVVEPAVTMSPADGAVCQDSPVTLNLTTRQSDVVYKIGEDEIFESTTTYSFIPNTSSVTVTASSTSACAGTNNKTKEFSISIKSLPEAPTFTSNSMTVCAGEPFTLPKPTNLKEDTEDCIWSVGGKTTTGSQPGISETTFYTAVKNDGCSSSAVEFTVNVNPLPIITISGSEKAVLYEDVTLTATATDGATVKWYEDDVEKGEGLTYVVTSETATSKIVTAKAFLNGCESAVASHTVAFSAETCAPSNQIQIICTSTKSTTTYCYAFYGSNKTEIFGSWPGTKGTASGNVYSWTIENKDNVTIIFNAGKNTNQTDDLTGHEKGKKYFYTFDSSKSKDNTPENYTLTDTEDILSISAPAAKTIRVSTTEGEGNIIFSGQVVKTGCDATNEYGFQYSSDEQTWTTVKVGENAAAGTAISNNTVKGLDGTYYVRAYITNDNSTQYGAVTEITVSTTKTPISNVTLNYCDENGGNVGVDPNPMCKGAIAYVKLSYVGSKYSDIKWLVEGVETNLVTDKGNGVWSYIIQGTGHLSVELRNDANKDNEDNPTWATSDKLSFTMKEEPVAPYISINPASGVICQGSSATIKVENPSADCSYKLVEGDTETGFTKYESGDLKYTVQNVGKYYVVAQHYECTDNEYTSNQVAINQIISTSAKISIEPKNQETTPWEPVNITVTADEGYVYEVTYTGNNNLQDVEGVIIKQKGDTYTYYIPRPTGWGEGNAVSVRTPVAYGIKAQLKVDGEANQCNLSFDTATITVKDEENEVCD